MWTAAYFISLDESTFCVCVRASQCHTHTHICMCTLTVDVEWQHCPFYFLLLNNLAWWAAYFPPVSQFRDYRCLPLCSGAQRYTCTLGIQPQSSCLSSKHFAKGTIFPALRPQLLQCFTSQIWGGTPLKCLREPTVCSVLTLTYPFRIVLSMKPPYDWKNNMVKLLWLVTLIMNVGGKYFRSGILKCFC